MNTTPHTPDNPGPDGQTPAADTAPVDETPTAVLLEAKDGDTVASAAAPTRRRAVWVTAIAIAALLAVAVGGYFTIQAIQHAQAVTALETAIADRKDAYAAQDDALRDLHDTEAQAVTTYMAAFTIGTTLTDSTVDDPATRTAVLAAATELAQTASIELDENNTALEEQDPLMEALVPEIPFAGPKPAQDIDALTAQTAELRKDAKALDSYTTLLTGIVDDLTTDLTDADTAVDAALASAAAKGQSLTYAKAPAETKTMVTAAAALVTDEAAEASLEDKAALVDAYLVAVRAASAKQKTVLAAEKAEADRIAAEQQRQNQNNSNGSRGTSNGSWNGGSKPGNNGGSKPGNGGTTPGNGGTAPGGGGSNWQPLKLAFSGSTCSGAGGGQEATYGSTLNVPGTSVGSYSTYEIPGYGWGVTWKCKHW